MFPSFGLFADINCPLAQRGQCERPHCLYKHAAEARDTFGASSPLVFAGVRNGYSFTARGAPINETGDCLHELERITKEIETVRHEVEQEQRRLSHYRTVQADSRNNAGICKYETAGKHVDRGPNGLPSCIDLTKTHAKARKYVVDNSKPRTDLEYDPLSNFSADLRTYSSSGKDQKNQQGLKKARIPLSCDQKEPAKFHSLPSSSQSPELHDDSNEDSVLIIDVPPSPDEKRGQTQTPVASVAGKSSQDTLGKVTEAETVPILSDTSLKVTSPSTSRVDTDKVHNYCDVENNRYLPTCIDNKGLENTPTDGSVVDLTGCLKALDSECQKIAGFQSTDTLEQNIHEPASLLASSDKQDHSWNNPWCQLPNGVEKMNPLQPPKNSLFYKAPADNSLQTQHTKQAQTTKQQAPNRVHSQWPPEPASVVTGSQRMSGQMQGKATINMSSVGYEEQTESPSGSNTHVTKRAELSYEITEQLLVKADGEEVIMISSDDEAEELNYSEMELSDSDPMEECYRIFMEANNENKGTDNQPDVPVVSMDVVKPEVNIPPQTLRGKKRVAHEAKPTEQPVAKSRPQPQVLIPLRGPAASGFGSQPSVASKIQQVQQRASMLTASVKGGQAFVSATCQNKPDTLSAPSALTQTPENLQPAPVQNAYLNYIPVGTAVIEVGNNLHFILPEGAFPLPVTSSSSPVTSVLTPISQVHPSAFTVKQTYYPPAVTPMQRYRSTAPVLIPAQARKPSLTSALASTSLHSSPASCTIPQGSVQAVTKPVPAKRKLKQQCEAAKEKVPHDVRQRYVNMFTEEFLKTTANVDDAFEKALAEERTVYNRSMNKLKYLSIAVNALKKMKNQSTVAAKNEKEVNNQRLKGNIPLNRNKFKANDDMALYESLKDYVLTDEKLIESNYPVQHPERDDCAVLFTENKRVNADPLKRICCRCGATYSVSQTGKHIRKEECTYHYGKAVKNRVPGGVETRYSCCEGVMGAPGCQMFKLHVHDSLSLDGFVSTVSRCPSDTSCPRVYSLDCEMCYTIHGLELSRVTVVNSSLQVIYDTFVRPDNEVIDYNTRFSGISEEDVKGNHTSLREVQGTLLSFINADTILIGHGLETDLCLLKLLHGTVVDTSVVFPHRLGPPHKLTLNNLTAEYLRKIIQESVCGHDTAEDAAACMELMLWKVKEDGKMKK